MIILSVKRELDRLAENRSIEKKTRVRIVAESDANSSVSRRKVEPEFLFVKASSKVAFNGFQIIRHAFRLQIF